MHPYYCHCIGNIQKEFSDRGNISFDTFTFTTFFYLDLYRNKRNRKDYRFILFNLFFSDPISTLVYSSSSFIEK